MTKGHRFRALVLRKQSVAAALKAGPTGNNPHHIPYGGWRDGCCDCCIHGCCHPSCCLSCWCPLLQLGQILTRMKLGLLGNPNPAAHATGVYWTPFKVLAAALIGVLLWSQFANSLMFSYAQPPSSEDDDSDPFNSSSSTTGAALPPDAPGWVAFVLAVNHVVSMAFALWVLVLMIKTRSYIRRTYNIPGDGCEDCCCAYWCAPCTGTYVDPNVQFDL